MSAKPILTKQKHRICDGCGYKRALSGIAYLKRGWVSSFLCRDCADQRELSRLEELSRLREANHAHRT